ncbi:MAG TPA: Mur ligase family protein [Thermoanaerobaculia bacterium]|jgi:UDP-N-acetylmuramate: L-alanyl-gamma-D-glutamyl-meso-diaminopimelate ligase|nr:Mur ligase family protein [Thermoanaerobaculia bacterium]
MTKPDRTLEIYCMAVGGTGMAPLACLLQEQGHRVRGTDGPLYPPMSTLLERAGIHPLVGYDAAHLTPAPDLVVIGNAIRRDNPEAVEAERRGLAVVSMPQALSRFFLTERRPLVVAGTHGKTTTSAMAAWVWTACGQDPGYLVGGIPSDLPGSFHPGSAGRGGRFIVEGDEYNAAYFDRGPKFLHYRPETLLLTSVEYDHADLYPTPESFRAAYAQLLELLPESGYLVACGDTPEVRELARRARCPVLFYGIDPGNDLHPLGGLAGIDARPEASRFRVADSQAGEVEITLPMAGEHNVANALAVWAAARRDGLPAAAVVDALARFHGVKRRLEELGTARGVTVVDDFAHHPTAVDKTLGALRQRYPGRRLVVLFEPRSLTAGRTLFHDPYRTAFAQAGRVLFAPTFHLGRLAPDERLDFGSLAAELTRAGVPTTLCADTAEVLGQTLDEAGEGDVVVTMSSGSFDGMPHRVLAGLRTSGGHPQAVLQDPLAPEHRAL